MTLTKTASRVYGKAGAATLLLFFSSLLWAHDFNGEVGLEFRTFERTPLDSRQHNGNVSGYILPEYFHQWDSRRQSVTFEPFARLDENDEERTHFDIRELSYLIARNKWEARVGVRKVFWGVAESQHLVDIINQTDAVENVDGEDKLGQPMINMAWIENWGTLDFFLLLGFRERTFPGQEGRLRTQPIIDTDKALYQSGDEERHVDVAARYSHYFGDYDFGVAHFSGTGRDPTLLLSSDGQGNPVFIPRYVLIDQTSLDIQATKGSALWKFEGITRSGQGSRYSALVGGLEYTFVGVLQSAADVGALIEYHWDDRHRRATSSFQNDIFTGVRITLNDEQSTEFLGGTIFDLDQNSKSLFVEASRRLGSQWKMSFELRGFDTNSPTDPLYSIRRDDHAQFDLVYYY